MRMLDSASFVPWPYRSCDEQPAPASIRAMHEPRVVTLCAFAGGDDDAPQLRQQGVVSAITQGRAR